MMWHLLVYDESKMVHFVIKHWITIMGHDEHNAPAWFHCEKTKLKVKLEIEAVQGKQKKMARRDVMDKIG